MGTNPLIELQHCGQSAWLDFIRRATISSGELARWIQEDGLRGVTANPSIFEKAIAGTHDYDGAVRALAADGRSAPSIYEAIAVEDIQNAADVFRPTYEELQGRDGFVSLEVSPLLAHDTAATIDEAKRLWSEVQRPNVLIKVPATREGLPAIERLIGEGINVNVTLLFSLERYEEVFQAYLAGLEARAAAGGRLDTIASVASFFLSRIDVLLDPKLQGIATGGGAQGRTAASLQGEVAIASAKVAYQIYKRIIGGDRFRALASRGARVQRLLWASTSTKNPAYPDLKYVEPLIGPDTINTLPVETFDAYRDHGHPAVRIEEGVDAAKKTLGQLAELGIDLRAATQQLEDEGVDKFTKAYGQLLASVEQRRTAVQAPTTQPSGAHP